MDDITFDLAFKNKEKNTLPSSCSCELNHLKIHLIPNKPLHEIVYGQVHKILVLIALSYFVNLCMLGKFLCFLSSADFFQNYFVKKKSLRNTIKVSNGLDPDQDGRNVGPNMGSKCL